MNSRLIAAYASIARASGCMLFTSKLSTCDKIDYTSALILLPKSTEELTFENQIHYQARMLGEKLHATYVKSGFVTSLTAPGQVCVYVRVCACMCVYVRVCACMCVCVCHAT